MRDFSERRQAPRKRASMPSFIVVPRNRKVTACNVVDMSSAGAQLELSGSARAEHLPDVITLVLPRDKVEVSCEIRWRNCRRLGVKFLTCLRPTDYTLTMEHNSVVQTYAWIGCRSRREARATRFE